MTEEQVSFDPIVLTMDLTGREFKVYATVRYFASGSSREICSASQQAISDLSGYSVSTVCKSLKTLQRTGIIDIRSGKNARRTSCIYAPVNVRNIPVCLPESFDPQTFFSELGALRLNSIRDGKA